MYCVCLYKKTNKLQRNKYFQYPLEGFSMCNDIIRKTSKAEQLYIKRVGNKLHYIYSRGLDDGNIIGIYFESMYLCNDVNDLLIIFRHIIEELNINGLGITTVNRKKNANPESFTNRKVDFDIFFSENKISYRGTLLPTENIGVPKSDVVRCVYGIKGSEWIITQIKNGYYQIDVTCNVSPITGRTKSTPTASYWGWKTWAFFIVLMSSLITIIYIIYTEPVIKAHFKYQIENIIK